MIARMGKLMALSLLTTLAASVVFQPALLATPRKMLPIP
jgi:predicted RND superfamily exporter protein